MNQATALLGLLTETSLHAGSGSSTGVVDLPIQREGHNGWPCVFGSAVKGALRDRAEGNIASGNLTKDDVCAVFGPDTDNAAEYAGAIGVGDARLLLLPVRSLTTAFKWVTCPEALHRLDRDVQRLGVNLALTTIPKVEGDQALVADGSGTLYLEEYRFTLQNNTAINSLIPVLAKLMQRQDAEAELSKRLVLVSDDMFGHLTQAATPVNAHIALESATKTVRDGALWYEETLPPETLLYVPLIAAAERRKDAKLTATAILTRVTAMFAADQHWLQLGGNATVGMGWCAVSILPGRS